MHKGQICDVYDITRCTDLTKLPIGTEVETRNGLRGTIVEVNIDKRCDSRYATLIAIVCSVDGCKRTYTANGSYTRICEYHPLDLVRYYVLEDCEDTPHTTQPKTYFPIIIFIAGCNNPFKLIEKPEELPTCTTIKIVMTNAVPAILNELDAAYRLGVAHGKNSR